MDIRPILWSTLARMDMIKIASIHRPIMIGSFESIKMLLKAKVSRMKNEDKKPLRPEFIRI